MKMPAPMAWIKDQMLASPDNHERQLTEAELKVLRSLKKLSIPDWYLNKRSSPPKILNNATPIDCRPPTWKNPDNRKKPVVSKNLSETFSIEAIKEPNERTTGAHTGTYKIVRQTKEPETSPGNSESSEQAKADDEGELFDTWIPKVKLSQNISRTFPKCSPPRKIQNINIVLPPGPALNITESSDNVNQPKGPMLTAFGLKQQRFEVGARMDKAENGRRAVRIGAPLETTSTATQRTGSSAEKLQKTGTKGRTIALLFGDPRPLRKRVDKDEDEESLLQGNANVCTCASRGQEVLVKDTDASIIRSTAEKESGRNVAVLDTVDSRQQVRIGRFRFLQEGNETPGKEQRARENGEGTETPKKTPRKGRTIALILRSPSTLARMQKPGGEADSGKGRTIALLVGNSEFSTPKVNGVFKIRAASTPKYRPMNLFCSTMMDDVSEESISDNVLEKTLNATETRETSSEDSLDKTRVVEEPISEGSRVKGLRAKFDRAPLEKTEAEAKGIENGKSRLVQGGVRKTTLDLITENKLRSIEPIVYEKDEDAFTRNPRSVREFVRKINAKAQSGDQERRSSSGKKVISEANPRKSVVAEKAKCDLERKGSVEKNADLLFHPGSPSTRFLYSKRKSTELQNIVKSKQTIQGTGLVQGIIRGLSERRDSLEQKQADVESRRENFVRKVVHALEKGEMPEKVVGEERRLREDYDTGSCSESDFQAISSTSASVKDTDSSDLDQRSPSLKSDDETRFEYARSTSDKSEDTTNRTVEEEDSVYWIPVSRCQLPRTSSLLSMMSKLSTTGNRSPCVSPIRYYESETDQPPAWGVTLRRKDFGKLGRIEETAVTDSGYSDKSDKSERLAECFSASSANDETWTEEPRDDSVAGSKARSKRSSARRKTIFGRAPTAQRGEY